MNFEKYGDLCEVVKLHAILNDYRNIADKLIYDNRVLELMGRLGLDKSNVAECLNNVNLLAVRIKDDLNNQLLESIQNLSRLGDIFIDQCKAPNFNAILSAIEANDPQVSRIKPLEVIKSFKFSALDCKTNLHVKIVKAYQRVLVGFDICEEQDISELKIKQLGILETLLHIIIHYNGREKNMNYFDSTFEPTSDESEFDSNENDIAVMTNVIDGMERFIFGDFDSSDMRPSEHYTTGVMGCYGFKPMNLREGSEGFMSSMKEMVKKVWESIKNMFRKIKDFFLGTKKETEVELAKTKDELKEILVKIRDSKEEFKMDKEKFESLGADFDALELPELGKAFAAVHDHSSLISAVNMAIAECDKVAAESGEIAKDVVEADKAIEEIKKVGDEVKDDETPAQQTETRLSFRRAQKEANSIITKVNDRAKKLARKASLFEKVKNWLGKPNNTKKA